MIKQRETALLIAAMAGMVGCGSSSGHPNVWVGECGQFVAEEGEVAAVLPTVESGCVSYAGRIVRVSNGDDVLQSEICNRCPTKMALRTQEALTRDGDRRMNAADYYYRPVGVMQLQSDTGELLAGCPTVTTAERRYSVTVETVIPAGKAMYQTHDLSWTKVRASSSPDSSPGAIKVTQIWPPVSQTRGGDALAIGVGCVYPFDEHPVQGVAVSADVSLAFGQPLMDAY